MLYFCQLKIYKFQKVSNGRDKAGGGVVLDCRYVLTLAESKKQHVEVVIGEFLLQHDGPETLDVNNAMEIKIDEPEPGPEPELAPPNFLGNKICGLIFTIWLVAIYYCASCSHSFYIYGYPSHSYLSTHT